MRDIGRTAAGTDSPTCGESEVPAMVPTQGGGWGGTGAWHGDALGEEDAPVPMLLKRQTMKRFEPWRQADTAACARQWSCTMGSLEVLRKVLRGRTGDHSTYLLYHENKKH